MSALVEQIVIDEWRGLYGESWKGVIVDEAFAHPAKFSRALIRKIYDHVIAEGWATSGSSVIDPFGGVALGAFDAMRLGLNWTGCELEQKFVELGGRNIALWNERYSRMPNWGMARLLQGDSRKLSEVLGEASCCVTSPPYANDTVNERNGIDLSLIKKPGGHNSQSRTMAGYGEASGQLGAMKEGDHSLVISLPPYSSGEKGHPSLGSVNNDDWGRDGRDITRRRGKTGEYGATDGQIGAMPEGQLCVSSPPFESSTQVNNTPGDMTAGRPRWEGGTNSAARVKQDYADYSAEGNLGNMRGGFQTAISSPPYEDQDVGASRRELEKYDNGEARDQRRYGNLGSGETFWSASRLILEQLHQVLAPNAHAVFVVKAFVRDKKIVDFPAQWAQLCEAVGFNLLHDHHALLVEHSGTQGGFNEDKEIRVERKSFFRRLAESKGSPRIDHENILCLKKV